MPPTTAPEPGPRGSGYEVTTTGQPIPAEAACDVGDLDFGDGLGVIDDDVE